MRPASSRDPRPPPLHPRCKRQGSESMAQRAGPGREARAALAGRFPAPGQAARSLRTPCTAASAHLPATPDRSSTASRRPGATRLPVRTAQTAGGKLVLGGDAHRRSQLLASDLATPEVAGRRAARASPAGRSPASPQTGRGSAGRPRTHAVPLYPGRTGRRDGQPHRVTPVNACQENAPELQVTPTSNDTRKHDCGLTGVLTVARGRGR